MSTYGYRVTIFLLSLGVIILLGTTIFFAYRNSPLETPGENVTSEGKVNNSNNSGNTGGILSRTPAPSTPIPVAIRELKANALTLWSLYIRERYNRTGTLSDNSHAMYVFDVPSGVFCDLGSDSYSWLPLRYQSWILKCNIDSNKKFIAFVINGIAAEGLTGGIYYDTRDPLQIDGMGDWPEFCYFPDIPSTLTPGPSEPQKLYDIPTPTGTSSSQREK